MKLFAAGGPALGRLARLLPVVLVTLAGSGCAALFEGYSTAPNGLPERDDELRKLLASSAYDSAMAHVHSEDGSPSDELLRRMYRGIVAYYAGAYDTAIAVIEDAEFLAQDRITTSLSASALSTLTNDRILPYEPGSSERLLLHYYGMLAAWSQDDREAAAVEARRLSFILDRMEERANEDGEPGDGFARDRLRALLHYLAGVGFETYGAFDDADVSYRRAAALDSSLVLPMPSSDSGDVVVVIERGFVDHLAEENVFLVLMPEDVETLTGGPVAERIAFAALVTARVMAEIALSDEPRAYGDKRGGHDRHRREVRVRARDHYDDDDEDADADPYLLRVAWPVFRDDGAPLGTVVRAGVDSIEVTPTVRADVSSAIADDFAEEKAAILSRTVIRAVGRFALGEAAEKKADETSEGLGTLVGILTNIGSVAVERADTRSWHLLPGEIVVVRMRVPAGEHAISAIVEENVSTGLPRRIMLGTVDVRPGGVAVVTGRVWR